MPLTYAPYAPGGATPFSIGLSLLHPERWFEPDDRLAVELAVKDRLLVEHRDRVVQAEPETHDAQIEVRDAIVAFLLKHRPDLYRGDGETIDILPTARRIDLAQGEPLVAAARLVQDDLCLMRKGPDGWRLAAAVLTAPSAWSLTEKMGQPMQAIHAHVPGYDGMGERIARIFDNLAADKPVWRLNWSIYDDDVLFHPETKRVQRRWSGADGAFGEQAFVRVERQTLRKMPLSGDILFTIRVYVDPVAAFRTHPEGRALAAGLATRLAGLNEAQLRYKNLLTDRDRILAALKALS